MLETLLEGMAEYYSLELSQKVKRGRKINAENNFFSGGTITFGYTTKDIQSQFNDMQGRPIVKKTIVIDENNARYVRQAFQDIYDGMKSYDVIKKLKEQGVKTARGNYFDKSSLHRLLRNKKYITIAEYDGEEHAGIYPRLVDDEVFYRVQETLDKNKHNYNKLADDEYLLVSKMFCGKCGELMTGAGGTSKTGKVHHYYLCKNKKNNTCDKKRIKKEYIEDLVIDTTRKILTKENINHIATSVVSIIEKEQDNAKLRQLKKAISTIDKKKVNLISAIAECDDSDIRKSLYEEMRNLQQQRTLIESDIEKEETFVNTLSKTNIKHFLYQLRDGNINSLKYRKSLIATFIKAVYVYDDKVIIFFNNQSGGTEIKFDDVKDVEKFFCGDVGSAI